MTNLEKDDLEKCDPRAILSLMQFFKDEAEASPNKIVILTNVAVKHLADFFEQTLVDAERYRMLRDPKLSPVIIVPSLEDLDRACDIEIARKVKANG